MNKGRTETLLIAISGLLWLAMVGLAGAGHWFAGLYALLGLLLVYGVLGSAHKGQFDLWLVAFPSLVWLAMWAAAFWLGKHYAEAFAGREPDFTVLGFHPSFAAIVVLFVTLSVSASHATEGPTEARPPPNRDCAAADPPPRMAK